MVVFLLLCSATVWVRCLFSVCAVARALWCVRLCGFHCVSWPGMSHISRGHLPRFSAEWLYYLTAAPHTCCHLLQTLRCVIHSQSPPPLSLNIFLPTLSLILQVLCVCIISAAITSFFSPIIPLSLSSLSFIHGCFFFSGSTKPRLLGKASEIVCRPWNRVM